MDEAIKGKKGDSVEDNFKDIMKTYKRKPNNVLVDKSREFYNKHVIGILNIYATENEYKLSVIECWNRIMKERMFKNFTG